MNQSVTSSVAMTFTLDALVEETSKLSGKQMEWLPRYRHRTSLQNTESGATESLQSLMSPSAKVGPSVASNLSHHTKMFLPQGKVRDGV